MARHVSFYRRAHAAPACGAAGLKSNFTILDADDQLRLMKQLIEAAQYRRKALAGAHARCPSSRAGKIGADAGRSARGRSAGLRLRQGPHALCRVSGAAEGAQCGGFRRSAAHTLTIFRANRNPRRISRPLPLHAGRRISGHQCRPVSVAECCRPHGNICVRRRRRPVDLWLARRGDRKHPALRARFPRRQSDPAGTQLPLDARHPRRGVAA